MPFDPEDPRHQRALNRVNTLAKEARSMFRTVGPRISAADNAQDEAAVRHCSICTPRPRIWKCPVCQWETSDRWRMKIHNITAPEWCARTGRERARKWARNA